LSSSVRSSSSRQSLSVQDWAEAALDAMAAGGLDALAVEPLARQLGVTKGSFYWHFPNRDALVAAALERWEQAETEDIIRNAEHVADPYERIVSVFKQANSSVRSGRLYLALAAAAGDARVAEVVHRVSRRRLDYLRRCYEGLGMAQAQAAQWAMFAYATFIGNLQLRRDMPQRMPQGETFSDYVRLMIRTLIPRPAAGVDAPPEPADSTWSPPMITAAIVVASVALAWILAFSGAPLLLWTVLTVAGYAALLVTGFVGAIGTVLLGVPTGLLLLFNLNLCGAPC
jgi:Transcriptional regulator